MQWLSLQDICAEPERSWTLIKPVTLGNYQTLSLPHPTLLDIFADG